MKHIVVLESKQISQLFSLLRSGNNEAKLLFVTILEKIIHNKTDIVFETPFSRTLSLFKNDNKIKFILGNEYTDEENELELLTEEFQTFKETNALISDILKTIKEHHNHKTHRLLYLVYISSTSLGFVLEDINNVAWIR